LLFYVPEEKEEESPSTRVWAGCLYGLTVIIHTPTQDTRFKPFLPAITALTGCSAVPRATEQNSPETVTTTVPHLFRCRTGQPSTTTLPSPSPRQPQQPPLLLSLSTTTTFLPPISPYCPISSLPSSLPPPRHPHETSRTGRAPQSHIRSDDVYIEPIRTSIALSSGQSRRHRRPG
jgi:hypothetical protein